MKRLAGIAVAIVAVAIVLVTSAGASDGGRTGSGSYQVRAIFDNAAFAVAGEQVRIAGATVGSITGLAVTKAKRAAVTLTITGSGFIPFHADATCSIRPQSLIAERYIDCNPGTLGAPALQRIDRGGGAGQYLLPVTRTQSPIDSDIVQNISQAPLRERLSIILDELGTGLAGRGTDLNAVIRRADPALAQTDRVFRILATQRRTLAQLATDSEAVLRPLAQTRRQIADFVVQANRTAVASAQRRSGIEASIRLLPGFLRRLKPLMADLGQLADQGTPLMRSVGQSAGAVNRQFAALVPFASAARTALIELGSAAQRSQAALVATQPLAVRLGRLGRAAVPSSALLDRLTASLDRTGAIEDLMGVLFNGVGATNGFDANGHYVRTDALVGSCFGYTQTAIPGCGANFPGAATASVARRIATTVLAARRTAFAPALTGLLGYLIGHGR